MIAIEILENLTIYLRQNVFEVELVMATALMAIACKVIVLDYKELGAPYVWATAGVVLATSTGYWLVKRQSHRSVERVQTSYGDGASAEAAE
jgi:uncharacterized membrane protein (DUF373 family)